MPNISITWSWEEAFDKFGFGDGDGVVMTHVVENVLTDAGYTVIAQAWGMHNIVIESIKDASGTELIPSDIHHGYDNPREYLPQAIIQLLDTDPSTADAAKVQS